MFVHPILQKSPSAATIPPASSESILLFAASSEAKNAFSSGGAIKVVGTNLTNSDTSIDAE